MDRLPKLRGSHHSHNSLHLFFQLWVLWTPTVDVDALDIEPLERVEQLVDLEVGRAIEVPSHRYVLTKC
jgi:hypothetical protein